METLASRFDAAQFATRDGTIITRYGNYYYQARNIAFFRLDQFSEITAKLRTGNGRGGEREYSL